MAHRVEHHVHTRRQQSPLLQDQCDRRPTNHPLVSLPCKTSHLTCVTPRREELRDARRFQPSLTQPDHGTEACPPRTHHNRIIFVVNDGVRMR